MNTTGFLRLKYDTMPKNCDVVLTHDAPDIGEIGVIHEGWYRGERAGNKDLAKAIKEAKPKYSISGHIHSSSHKWEQHNDTKYIGVSIVNEEYKNVYEPLYFYI